MNSDSNTIQKDFSPSRAVWKTQLDKGTHAPHRVSRITCIVNKLFTDKIVEQIFKLGINTIFDETGRTTREFISPRSLGLPGSTIKMQSTPVNVLRFTVQRKQARMVMDYLVKAGNFNIPGRGTIFSQDLIEFTKKEPPFIAFEEMEDITHDIPYLRKLSYVICVLSVPGSGEKLAKVALDLGVCVPLITHGISNDLRDQLGLIRITISPEKEVVHLIMPEQDTESIIKLLLEEGRLDRPGRGYIYQTPISFGLIDTRMRVGRQQYAASMEQIIAAIDQIKGNTFWRKRLDTTGADAVDEQLWLPNDNCEISVVSEEDTEEHLKYAGMKAGATGSTVSRLKILVSGAKELKVSSLVQSTFSVSAEKTNDVVDALLQHSAVGIKHSERVQVLDSPAAYIHTF